MYRIHQIKLNLDEDKNAIPAKMAKKIGGRGLVIKRWTLCRESIDARNKSDIKRVYSVDFEIEEKHLDKKVKADLRRRMEKAGVEFFIPEEYEAPKLSREPDERPVIVGFGPAGIFAALILAQAGARPVVIERGGDVVRRSEAVEKFWEKGVLNTESNVQFGEGGAGAFSDGKLTTGIKDVRIRKVLQELVRFGAPEDILYKQKPHVGTDILKSVVKNIREEIISLGGTVLFDTKVTDIAVESGQITGLMVSQAGERDYVLPCRKVILAPGHSARDTFRMLAEKASPWSRNRFL